MSSKRHAKRALKRERDALTTSNDQGPRGAAKRPAAAHAIATRARHKRATAPSRETGKRDEALVDPPVDAVGADDADDADVPTSHGASPDAFSDQVHEMVETSGADKRADRGRHRRPHSGSTTPRRDHRLAILTATLGQLLKEKESIELTYNLELMRSKTDSLHALQQKLKHARAFERKIDLVECDIVATLEREDIVITFRLIEIDEMNIKIQALKARISALTGFTISAIQETAPTNNARPHDVMIQPTQGDQDLGFLARLKRRRTRFEATQRQMIDDMENIKMRFNAELERSKADLQYLVQLKLDYANILDNKIQVIERDIVRTLKHEEKAIDKRVAKIKRIIAKIEVVQTSLESARESAGVVTTPPAINADSMVSVSLPVVELVWK